MSFGHIPGFIFSEIHPDSFILLAFTSLDRFNRQELTILFFFFFFFQKIGFDISCKLSSWETICIKCQI